MNSPQTMTSAGVSGHRSTQPFQPLPERLGQSFQPYQRYQHYQSVPSNVKEAMLRTLGSHALAPLPAKPSLPLPVSAKPGLAAELNASKPSAEVAPVHTASKPVAAQAISYFPTSVGFVALLAAYRSTGGMVRADALSWHLRSEEPGHLTNLARKLVSGAILNFSWRQTLWVPLFQFEPHTSTIKPAVAKIMQELQGTFDSWEISVWFVQPNSWLKGQRPLDVIDRLYGDVVQAARADRFVAAG